MPEKILYYLGAGASANALPMVKGLPSHMRQMAGDVRRELIGGEHQLFLNRFADDLDWLASECDNFSTIDTYAKHLYLKDRALFEKLKITLSLYFTLEQLWNNKFDKRYLIWLTSILNRKMFPDNIKIVTWNYDFQLQLAAENYHVEEFSYANGVSVHTPPMIRYYPQLGDTFSIAKKSEMNSVEYSLTHLNGIAGFYHDQRTGLFLNPFISRNTQDKRALLNHFIEDAEKKKDLLTFAWEKDSHVSYIIQERERLALKMVEDTTIVVVIGYSFPFFNRDIDKLIFHKLKGTGELRKIYFQDPNLDGSFLYSQFNLMEEEVEIKHINRIDSFYIPFEL